MTRDRASKRPRPHKQRMKRSYVDDQLPPLDDDDVVAGLEAIDAKRARVEPVPVPAAVASPAWTPPKLDAASLAPYFHQLATQGYTVIEGVVDPLLCASVHERLRAFLVEALVPLEGNNIKVGGYNPHGIHQHLEAGHAQAVWDVRMQPGVASVFEHMYGDNDLQVSFDGFCYMPAGYRDNGRNWFHTDQSHNRPGLRCIQSYVNITSSHDAQSGSLEVVPRSHLMHSNFRANDAARANNDDWFKYDPSHIAWMACPPPVRVFGGVGSLVLWDSRTAHHARPPSAELVHARDRCVVYVCMQPRLLADDKRMASRVKWFDSYRMTTHWPASKVKPFSKEWHSYGKPKTVRTPARTRVESPRMLELAGKTRMVTQERRRSPPGLKFVQ